MAKRPMRTVQRSVRLTPEEAEDFDALAGYRDLWDFSELVRAGLQLLLQAEREDVAAGGAGSAVRLRRTKKRGVKR